MTQYSQKALIPYAELTDAPNIQTYAQGLSTVLDSMVLPNYALLTTRNAQNPSPTAGDSCYVAETDRTYIYSSSVGAWVYMTPWTKYKTVLTTRTGTSRSDDPHLTFTLEASSVYRYEVECMFSASGAGGAAMNMTNPASSNISGVSASLSVNPTTFNGEGNWVSTGLTTGLTTMSGGDSYNPANLPWAWKLAGVCVTTTAGTLAVSWAQHVNTGNSTLGAGSTMTITKIG